MQNAIGIDAGGTSVRVLRSGQTEPERYAASASGGPEALSELRDAAVTSVCAGITKISRGGVKEHWEEALTAAFPNAKRRIVPDYLIAFHGAIPEGVGLMVVAGTGSVVYGEDGLGNALRVGGRGWEFGDEGSGSHLSTELIKRTLRGLDGLSEISPLQESVCELLKTSEPAILGEKARRCFETDGRGFLVPLILEKARSGDREAIDLFVGAAGWLARLTRAAAERLALPTDAPLAIATVGGLWETGNFLHDPFVEVLSRWLPNAQVQLPQRQPVDGALALAERGTYNTVSI
jgi:N-acetylglucosamine kinase-like BadF-type ATPase